MVNDLQTRPPQDDADSRPGSSDASSLENDFASPSIDYSDRNAREKTPEELAALEAAAAQDKPEASPDSREAGWQTDVSDNKSSKNRKKILFAAGGGGIILVGALIFIMMMFGSFKAIHYATVLRSTGFAAGLYVTRNIYNQVAYDAAVLTDDSTGSLTRPERSMYDLVRGVNAEEVMKSLGRDGATGSFEVVKRGGRVEGFEVNGRRYMNNDFAQNSFGRNYNDLTFRERMTVKNDILKTAGDEMAEVFSTESRTFRTGFFKGFRTHFKIRTSKFAQKTRELVGKNAKEAKASVRENTLDTAEGVEPRTTTGGADDIEPTDRTGPRSNITEIDEAAQATRRERLRAIKEGFDLKGKDIVNKALTERGTTKISEFAEGAGKVSLAVLIATLYCTARDIIGSLNEINAEKEANMQRFAHDVQTTADQIQSHEASADAANAAGAMWDGAKNSGDYEDVLPADSSPFYKAAFGDPTDTLSEEYFDGIPNGSINVDGLNTVVSLGDAVILGAAGQVLPGDWSDSIISGACAQILNPAVQTGIAVGDIALSVVLAISSGGTSEGIKAGIRAALYLGAGLYGGNLVGKWLEETINNWAGGGATGAEVGIERFNTAKVSTDYQNSATAKGVNYARPLDNDEAEGIKTEALLSEKNLYEKKPWKERYFAINNPFSLIGRVSAITPSNFSAFSLRLSSVFTDLAPKNMAKRLMSLGDKMLNVFNPNTSAKAYAASQGFEAENHFFGVPQWGWSKDELAKINGDDESYSLIKNGGWVIERNANGELDQKYEKCYTPEAISDVPKSGCDKNTLKSDEAFRWRYYKASESAIDDLADTEISSSDGGNVGSMPTDVVDEDQIEAIEGIDPGCHKSIAGNVRDMLAKAKTDGITLGGSCWRSFQRQVQLRTINGCPDIWESPPSACRVPTAIPGKSMHERGLAIDFTCNGGGQISSRSDPCFIWLNDNAKNYGLFNLPSEPWHWSTNGS